MVFVLTTFCGLMEFYLLKCEAWLYRNCWAHKMVLLQLGEPLATTGFSPSSNVFRYHATEIVTWLQYFFEKVYWIRWDKDKGEKSSYWKVTVVEFEMSFLVITTHTSGAIIMCILLFCRFPEQWCYPYV